jgi:uncharacterized membrane protein YjjP (DUF1212 family)
VTTSRDQDDQARAAALDEAVDVLLRFGAAMLRSGDTVTRTRMWAEVVARKLGCDALSISLSSDAITASVRRAGASTTGMREIGPSGTNAWRIGELEALARTLGPEPAPRDIAARIAAIEATPPRHAGALIVAALGLASGAFAFLNGAGAPEMIAAALGGAFGQWLRSWLHRRAFNPYGTAAACAVAASGAYVAAAALAGHAGFGFAQYPVGVIASVLFLVPGFPLISALFDLLQTQTLAAVSRFAFGAMILAAVALGLSIVIALAGIDLSRPPPLALAYPLALSLRAVASFIAGGAFALLFNCTAPIALACGLVALVANDLRLVLIDAGMMPAPAAYLAALAIGLVAMLASRRFRVPPMALAVAPIVIMVPGRAAFEAIVLLNHGQMVEALQAAASCGFTVGGLAMGLATARMFVPTDMRE